MKPEIMPTFTPPEISLVQALKPLLTGIRVATQFQDIDTPQAIITVTGGDLRGNGTHLLVAFSVTVSASSETDVLTASYQVMEALNNIRSAPFHWIESSSLPIYFEEQGSTLDYRFIPFQAFVSSQ